MSSIDASILNEINIKQLAEAVIETHGGTVDRSSPTRWQVELPTELADLAGTATPSQKTNTGNSALDSIAQDIHGSEESESQFENTLVFDSQHEEPGEDDLVVEPGTPFFNSLLELAQDETAVTSIRLGPESFQIHDPPLVESLGKDARAGEFQQDKRAVAIAYHFHVQFEGTQSYHQEEFETVTLDAQTGANLPKLTDRFLAHLGDLSQEAMPTEFGEIDAETTERLYISAIDIIKERLQPELEELHTEATEAAAEREDEIRNLFEQRREELDAQVRDKQQKVRELGRKAKSASNNKKEQDYIERQQDIREELNEISEKIDTRKERLRQEEREQIASTTARHAVEADVTNIGTTIITYDIGELPVQIYDDGRIGETTITYIPATNEFGACECADCGRELETNSPPVVCDAGHVICPACRQQCEQCDLIGCSHEGLTTCEYCGTIECATCTEACGACERTICNAHRVYETQHAETLCQVCGGECSTCGDVFDDEELVTCQLAVDSHCLSHFGECRCSESWSPEECGSHCSDHIEECISCANSTCDEHLEPCIVCDGGVCVPDRVDTASAGTLCCDHAGYCEQCEAHHIASDLLTCAIDDTPVCEAHASRCAVCENAVCNDHLVTCETCDVRVCIDHAERCDHCDRYHCEKHSTTCDVCEESVGTDHVEACTECETTVCPSDSHACGACDSIFCAAHTTPCKECDDRFCYDHLEGCATCMGWACETHLNRCSVCDARNCPSHTETCMECGEVLCKNHTRKCKNCDKFYCPADATVCSICEDTVCPVHATECAQCGTVLCSEDLVECSVCQTPHCPDDTVVCDDCNDVFCSEHIIQCAGCDNAICEADSVTCDTCGEPFEDSHIDSCASCAGQFCATHRETCTTCDDSLCTEHAYECGTDGQSHCGHHLETCAICVTDNEQKTTPFCEEHRVTCSIGGESLCPDHTIIDPILIEPNCREHTTTCDLCQQDYAPPAIEDDRCKTCHSIGAGATSIPESVAADFRSVRGAENKKYMMFYGKKLFGSNQLIVVEKKSDTELVRRKIGLIARLKGVFR